MPPGVRPPVRQARRPVAQRTAKSAHVQAPVGGFNSTDAAATIPAAKCVYAYNVLPGENGLRPRLGSIEHATLTADTGEVRTTIPFKSHDSGTYPDKMFAATPTGLYDVTAQAAGATQVFAWPSATGLAGYCTVQGFNNGAESFILLTDEVNGYYVYTASTNTWARVVAGTEDGQINGANPNNFAFVTIWKNRVWFVDRNSGASWYLPVGQFAGTVSRFDFGNKFQKGGHLAGLWSATLDGGAGIDDLLVAVSTGGDVLVYQGTDPGDVTLFSTTGSWNIGTPPPGRRFVTDFGGDLLILSSMGAVALSKLTKGSTLTDPDLYTTKDVANLFTRLMDERRDLEGWSVVLHPRENIVMVLVPRLAGDPSEQLAYSLATRGWFRLRGLDMASASSWNGDLFFGTSDGRVVENSGDLDDVRISTGEGVGISFSGLTSYQTFGTGHLKRGLSCRPMLVCSSTPPTLLVEARYDFNLTEILNDPPVEPPGAGLFVWSGGADGSAWDADTWGGTFVNRNPVGLRGMGVAIAIGFRGISYSRFSLVGWNVTWDEGGPT